MKKKKKRRVKKNKEEEIKSVKKISGRHQEGRNKKKD